MSRPIAYNASGPLSGSIRGGSVNYTVDSGNRDYTTFASKKWVPSADGVAPIVFVTDSYTQGIELNPSLAVPLFFSCNGTGSAAIIYTANRIPGSPGNYTDANVALNDLITARGYFILESNDPYQGDYQSGNLLDIDASKMSSYPQTGTTWRDLSGNSFDFSLVNGPSWQSSGWFNIDGTDDAIILTGNSTLQSTNTLVVWLRTTDTTGLLLTGSPLNSTGPYYVAAYYPGQGFYSGAAGSPDYFMNTLATVNPATPINYLDGRFYMWEVKGLNFSGWTTTWNFFNYQAGYQIAGDVAKIQMFNSYLTSAQSKQLYFGSPIVTDGLVFAVDANNLVSYPKSGTTLYNLTGSGATGTLTNGTSFNISNGGSFVFDGTNDYISFPNDANLDSQAITMESWSNINSLFQDGFLFEKGNVNTQYSNFFNSDGTFYFRTVGLSTWDLTFYAPSYISPNTWNHIVCTYSSGVKTIYINGVQINQLTGITGTIPTNTAGLFLGAYGPGSGYFLNGKIANSRVYNKALSAAEVLQNYQSEQYRFDYANGSTAALAAPSAAYLYNMGVRTNGLYYINTLSGGPVQVYCDFTTLDVNGESGWMLVGSWDNSYTWTLSANSSNSVFGSTPLNCVSSNFGNNPINQFRVQVASTVNSGGASAVADFYYNWNNNPIMWKEVWAPDGTLTYYYLSQGSNPAVPRASIKQFDNSYNINGGYNNPNHKWNNISDYGYQNTPLPGGLAAVGGPSAPAAGLCPFWTALTTSGNTFGVYCMGRSATFSTCTSPDVDGTLAIPTNGAGTDTTGQDVDSNVSAKYGYDDGVVWQSPSNNKMWWWIK
jgi:hypothetical protein